MAFSLDFPFAYGGPLADATFRRRPEDFVVNEQFDPPIFDSGEHLYLDVEKIGHNTQWLADKLATFCGVKSMDVSFCGLKDRHAITRQWYSIYSPKQSPFDAAAFIVWLGEGGIVIHKVVRGAKKLRRGEHAANHFAITLHELRPTPPNKTVFSDVMEKRLQKIAAEGVPNYFGEQRFGFSGNNLLHAEVWAKSGASPRRKKPKGMIVSAARSYLFNLVLAQRVRDKSWSLLDRHKHSSEVKLDDSGPLWGRGRSPASSDTVDFETDTLVAYRDWCHVLEYCGLQQARRPLMLRPDNFTWEIVGTSVTVRFELLPGEFATSVLRELFTLKNVSILRD